MWGKAPHKKQGTKIWEYQKYHQTIKFFVLGGFWEWGACVGLGTYNIILEQEKASTKLYSVEIAQEKFLVKRINRNVEKASNLEIMKYYLARNPNASCLIKKVNLNTRISIT